MRNKKSRFIVKNEMNNALFLWGNNPYVIFANCAFNGISFHLCFVCQLLCYNTFNENCSPRVDFRQTSGNACSCLRHYSGSGSGAIFNSLSGISNFHQIPDVVTALGQRRTTQAQSCDDVWCLLI